MPFQPVPDTASFAIHYDQSGQDVVNVLHVKDTLGWDADKLETVCELIEAWADANLLPLLSNEFGLVRISARDLTTETSYVFEHAVSPPIGGGIAGPAMPNNVAVTVSLRSGLAGRSNRGRNYVAGIAKSSVTQNTIDATLANGLTAAYTQLIEDVETPDRYLVIVSRVQNGVVLPVGTTVPVESAILVDRVVDSQRRRLPGRGS